MMIESIRALTIQFRVDDFAQGSTWYEKLIGRTADFKAADNFWEWELLPNAWLQIAEGTPTPGSGPLRLGVDDIETTRQRVIDQFQVEVSAIERVEGVAAWCTFTDPFGNRIGLFQDLADTTE